MNQMAVHQEHYPFRQRTDTKKAHCDLPWPR